MKLTQRLLFAAKTLNPDQYEGLCRDLTLRQTWSQFLFTFGLLFLVAILLSIPAAFLEVPKLQGRLSSFDTLELGGNYSSTQPITLLAHPHIIADLRDEPDLSSGSVILTRQGITGRWLFSPLSGTWEERRDLAGASRGLLLSLLLFLAPSILFWLGLVTLLGTLAFVLLFGFLGGVVPRVWRHLLPFSTALKVSLFSSTPLLIAWLLLPFRWGWWLGPLLFLLFFAIGLALVGEREYAVEERPRKQRR